MRRTASVRTARPPPTSHRFLHPACSQVRQMTLLDELGQVSHVFSDKTGTLTSNHMEFRRLLIDGQCYGVGDTAISRSLRARKGVTDADAALRLEPPPAWAFCRPQTSAYVSFEQAASAPDLFSELVADGDAGARRRELIVHLAVNHSVPLPRLLCSQGHRASRPCPIHTPPPPSTTSHPPPPPSARASQP